MEELLLRLLLAGDELDIVHQEKIGAAVFGAQILAAADLDGVDEIVREIVALDVYDLRLRIFRVDRTADGEKKVRFAEPGVAVNEKRVIELAGVFRHGDGRGVGVFVRRSHDEVIECEACDLRERIVRFRFGDVAVQLVPGEDRQLELGGEKVAERIDDRLGKAGLDNVALELRGCVDDEPVIHDLDRRAVVKPGVQRRGGQILPENGKNAVPYVVEGIHSFSLLMIRKVPGDTIISIIKLYHLSTIV